MEFKAGDRVHVTRLVWRDVDFYATLQETNSFLGHPLYRLVNCTNLYYQNYLVRKENSDLYGERDYYTLATDEEDTEEPVIQRINEMYNDVPTHYKANIDVIEFCRQHFTDEEFKGAMKFNLIKYPTRLGRKDDMVKELDKIIDYAQRYKEVLENEPTQ
ncbi:DUF3310 domain-containing protein [Mammaliicoccus sciuri]|uniref:DUF3310 domain-containing protein n=1 Tax=Mammaliicoccus sciuri TaxID=1296 RepID=UPI001FB530F3|nr:DUF3310 domain-containing protein [Mammaliicoccus sciuri]MCJ0924040.1 DUF3310 domain-containing protein [Mammaliicoccus sciuri]